MGKMKDILIQIDEEFERVAERVSTADEAQKVLNLILNSEMTVSEAVTYIFYE